MVAPGEDPRRPERAIDDLIMEALQEFDQPSIVCKQSNMHTSNLKINEYAISIVASDDEFINTYLMEPANSLSLARCC